MRHSIREFVKIVTEEIPCEAPIYEFGSLQVPGQEGFADMRPFFPNKNYVGFDFQLGPGVDVVMNAHTIDKTLYETAETILCLDTMEHIMYPVEVMDEFYKVLKPNGILVVSSVMAFPIHNYPQDFWRFTPQGFQILFSKFKVSIIDSAGKKDFPHTVVGIGFKGVCPPTKNFSNRLNVWKESLKNATK